ncbi:hypothetical protein C791_4019 [Amycolatopsis azurea DSM 43854]|uniref:DUF6734 domain-containing protein n=1 Tax=Amycolatopsis azurea DSM 43854 TaxID=1238180 RepID=M2QIM5_9PSEU|nr:hypothetical protein C791_4019 [Amycolatopsis azurea DSM 43854]
MRSGYGEIIEPDWRPPHVRVVRPGDKVARPIRRAVWSFWSTPYRRRHGRHWPSDFFHALSWILSFRLASRLFPTTALVTDDRGHELLVDRLELPFDDVSLSLNRLTGQAPSWWALGKLHAYREQREPFLHIDNDVFLWPGFPAEGLDGEIVAQNPEHAPGSDAGYYRPAAVATAIRNTGGFLPKEFSEYTGRQRCAPESSEARRSRFSAATPTWVSAWWNRPRIKRPGDGSRRSRTTTWSSNSICSAHCAGVARRRTCSASSASQEDSHRDDDRRFTHLIASAKSDLHYTRLLARRVRNHFPADFEIARRRFDDQ